MSFYLGKPFGIPVVVKESGGRFYLSKTVPWDKQKEGVKALPPSVQKNTELFRAAVSGCKLKDKKRTNVFEPSEFNTCVRDFILTQRGKPIPKAESA